MSEHPHGHFGSNPYQQQYQHGRIAPGFADQGGGQDPGIATTDDPNGWQNNSSDRATSTYDGRMQDAASSVIVEMPTGHRGLPHF